MYNNSKIFAALFFFHNFYVFLFIIIMSYFCVICVQSVWMECAPAFNDLRSLVVCASCDLVQ